MKSSRPDVFAGRVYLRGEFGYTFDRVVGKTEVDVIYGKQRRILLDNRIFGTVENVDEVFARKAFEFDLYRKSALKFGYQIFYGGTVERTRG